MLLNKFVLSTLAVSIVIFISGCISIGLQSSAKSAKGVQVQAPGSPFQSFQDPAFDRAWRNSVTRSILSYKSECQVPATNTDRILSDLRQIIPDLSVTLTSQVDVDDREAQIIEGVGAFDGRRVKIRFVHFRKSQCNFLISLQSAADQFDRDISTFNNFLKEFKSP